MTNTIINNMVLAEEDKWHIRNNRKPKEIKIFCNPETGTALVRIFKLRNYNWSGGKTYELKKDSDRLSEISLIIKRWGEFETGNSVWNTELEVAKDYKLDMSFCRGGIYKGNFATIQGCVIK